MRKPVRIQSDIALVVPNPNAVDRIAEIVSRMGGLTKKQRVVAFQALSDFYCPRCGRAQPPGDCQCEK